MSMMTNFRLVALLVAISPASLTAACGDATEPRASGGDATSTRSAVMSEGERFDPLAISLTLHSNRVASGKTLRSRLAVANPSAHSVTDPRCLIATGRYALVPLHNSNAELWEQPISDCGGPHEMEPGFRDESDGPSFLAHTKYGDPLPVGKYLAVLEIQGLSQRLEYPVTVE